MDVKVEELSEETLKEFFSKNQELVASAVKTSHILCDFVDLIKDKYPGTTSAEVAFIGLQLYCDACDYHHKKKEDIIALAAKFIKER